MKEQEENQVFVVQLYYIFFYETSLNASELFLLFFPSPFRVWKYKTFKICNFR